MPYILNAIDGASGLVIGQLVIHEKTNEMTAIPELVELLEINPWQWRGVCPSGEEEQSGAV